jgi:murein L,D-transpeptidase YafK
MKRVSVITILVAGLLVPLFSFAQPQDLTEKQLGHARVWNARLSADQQLKKDFEDANLQYPPRNIYWRAFKKEQQVELWAADSAHHLYKLVKTYYVVRMSGMLGPKRTEGDHQVPEGYYYINQYNPNSNFYLSFKISYPNKSDSILGSYAKLGGQIFVHGDSLTVGCLPMTNPVIKELYWCALQAQSINGQNHRIPFHIYPCRLESNEWKNLKKEFSWDANRLDFWKNLQDGYNYFEVMRQPPPVAVGNDGRYRVVYSW